MNEVRGIVRIDAMHARSFTYTWKKTSPDEAEAILSGLDGSFTLLRLHFSGPQLGRWGMEDIPSPQAAALVRETRDSGAFSFRRGLFARSIEHASLPTDLPGRTIVFNEAGKLTKLEFPDATSVVMTSPRGGRIQGTYSYDPLDSHRGTLQLNLRDSLSFALKLTGPGMGRFDEIPEAGGPPGPVMRGGGFTLPDEPSPPDDPDCPPEDISGRSFVIKDSRDCLLVFGPGGKGEVRKLVGGALEVITFVYSYSRTGGNSACVSVTFPGAAGDLIDEYELVFADDCNGSFHRDSSTNGSSSGSATGKFGPGNAAGVPAGAPAGGAGF
jgi:hypothetical protein